MYTTSIATNFAAGTIAGQGFLFLTAMIFGKWHPIGALGAVMFFRLAQSLSITGSSDSGYSRDIPSVLLTIAPVRINNLGTYWVCRTC